MTSNFFQDLRAVGLSLAALLLLCGAAVAEEPPLRGHVQDFILIDPPLSAPEGAFQARDGQSVKLGDFGGKVLLVNFWATWCAPCVREMPSLDRLQAELGGEDFEVVAISVDRGGLKTVEPFFAREGLENLAIYLDPTSDFADTMGVPGLPVSFLVDRNLEVVGALPGETQWDSEEAKALIRHYLGADTRSDS